jgi:hypothetical protein
MYNQKTVQPPSSLALFSMFERVPVNNKVSEIRTTIQQKITPYKQAVIDLFYLPENIKYLNKTIINNATNQLSGTQTIALLPLKKNDLSQAMHTLVLGELIPMQSIPIHVTYLNKDIVNQFVTKLTKDSVSHAKYIYDINHLYVPIDRPSMASQKYNSIEFKGWFETSASGPANVDLHNGSANIPKRVDGYFPHNPYNSL